MLTFALFLQLHQINLQAVFYNHSTRSRNSAAAQMQLHQCKAQLQLLSVYGRYIREAPLYLQHRHGCACIVCMTGTYIRQAPSYIQHSTVTHAARISQLKH